MKKVFIYIFLFVIEGATKQSLAQTKQIDSLKALLKTSKEDTNKVKILSKLSDKLWRAGNYDTALIYANQALALTNSISNIQHIAFPKGAASAYPDIGIRKL